MKNRRKEMGGAWKETRKQGRKLGRNEGNK